MFPDIAYRRLQGAFASFQDPVTVKIDCLFFSRRSDDIYEIPHTPP